MEYIDRIEKFRKVNEYDSDSLDEEDYYDSDDLGFRTQRKRWNIFQVEEFYFYQKNSCLTWPGLFIFNKNTDEIIFSDTGLRGGISDVRISNKDGGRIFELRGRLFGQVIGYYPYDLRGNLILKSGKD